MGRSRRYYRSCPYSESRMMCVIGTAVLESWQCLLRKPHSMIAMHKIVGSVKHRPLNMVLISTVLVLYLLNNSYFKLQTTGIIRYFLVCYFNDLICPVLFFSYANLLLLTVDKEITQLWQICFIGLCASCFWEFGAPYIKLTAVTDPIDIVFYLVGSVIYWGLLRCVRKPCR